MSWIETHGRRHQVRAHVDGRKVALAFDTIEDAERFAHAVDVHGWRPAYDYVTRGVTPTEQAAAPTRPTARIPGTGLDLRPAGVTVGDLCRMYVRQRRQFGQVQERTLEQYESYIAMHIDPFFGDIDAGFVLSMEHAADPDLPTAVGFRAHLLAKPKTMRIAQRTDGPAEPVLHPTSNLSPKTVRGVIALASSAYRLAMAADVDRVVDRNPFSRSVGTAPKPQRVESTDCLTAEQVHVLLGALSGRLAHGYPVVLFLVMTGLRWAEASGLQVKHLHLDGCDPRVDVVTGLQRRKRAEGGGWYLGRLKSHASRRTLSLPPMLVDELRPLTKGKGPEDLVFTTAMGQALHHGNFVDRVLKRAIAATNGAVPATLRPHGLRHTCATLLLEQGKTSDQVARQLGHEDSTLVDTVYGHFSQTLRRGNADALQHALTGRAPDQTPTRTALTLASLADTAPVLDKADLALPEIDLPRDEEAA